MSTSQCGNSIIFEKLGLYYFAVTYTVIVNWVNLKKEMVINIKFLKKTTTKTERKINAK